MGFFDEWKRKREEKKRQKAHRRQVLRRHPSYGSIHRWLEFRVGKMEQTDPELLHQKLLKVVEQEREKNKAPRLMGDGDYDPYKGLEAYITTHAYRKMLSK